MDFVSDEVMLGGSFVVAILLLFILSRLGPAPKDFLCKSCGAVGPARRVTPGSFLLELILWLCFLVPGILYSIYRISLRHNACGNCLSRDIIPKDSPVAARMLSEKALTK